MSRQSNSIVWRAFEAIKGKKDNDIYRDYILAIFLIKYLSDNNTKSSLTLDSYSNFEYIYKNRNVDYIGKLINDALNEIDEKYHFNGRLSHLDYDSSTYLGGDNSRNESLAIMLEEMSKLDFSSKDYEPANVFNYFVEAVAFKYRNSEDNFTPLELVKLLCSLTDLRDNDTIYDPDCGYGSLLTYGFSEINGGKVFGQVDKENLYMIAEINMLINGIDDADIQLGNIINNPKHLDGDKLKKFDVVISNPSFMTHKWTKSFDSKFTTDPFNRFEYGVPPENKVESVYISHMLNSLKDNGRMAILTIPSVLFREGSEGYIRKNIIENNLIDGIITLPQGLMANTALPYVIIVFKKNRIREKIIMIDASSTDHVIRDGTIKRLSNESLDKIIDIYKEYKEVDYFSRLVTIDEIRENDYNLNIPRYISNSDFMDKIDVNSIKSDISHIEDELSSLQNQIQKLINRN